MRCGSRSVGAPVSVWALVLVTVGLIACQSAPARDGRAQVDGRAGAPPSPTKSPSALASRRATSPAGLSGMPPVLDPRNIYAATQQGLTARVRGFPQLVYVPNGRDGTLTVIDLATRRVVRTVPAGRTPQHVVPSYDLRTLWVNSSESNTLTRLDPATGRVVATVAVDDPYNLYFTPDGRDAIVMAERLRRLDFRDPQTMRLRASVPVPCAGLNHADFSADGSYFVASCEFSAQLIKVGTRSRRVLATLQLPRGSKPQDVKLSPDGSTFYVADLNRAGVWTVDGRRLATVGFVATGRGAHGLYVSRSAADLYVTNRGEGTVSVVSLATKRVRATWRLPRGATPDMGNLSPDGRTIWLSARYGRTVYVLDTRSGATLAQVPVGSGPHGLTVFPLPGRYSLGHTGVLR